MYFAKRLDIAFPSVEDKNDFDNWFYQQEFSSVDNMIERVESFLEGNGIIALFDEEDYIKSVYKEYFGESWFEEYSRRN